MSEYQNRKDIDSLLEDMYGADFKFTQFAEGSPLREVYTQVDENGEPLNKGTLDAILEYLDVYNSSAYNEKFRQDLLSLDGNLTSLGTSLDELSLDLYGDDDNDGLTDYLNELQVLLYGKGGTDTLGNSYTINNPSPISLKGRLNTLESDTSDLQTSLNALTIGLTSFSMTLNEFKAELTSNGISYSELDTGITTLLELILNAQRRIDTVQQDIGDTSQITGSVVNAINNVDGKAVDVRKKLYSGTNDNGTIGSPATGTVKDLIDTAQSDIIDVQEDIGTVDVTNNGNLSNQSLSHKNALNDLLNVALSLFTPVWILDYTTHNYTNYADLVNKGYIEVGNHTYEFWKNNNNGSFVRTIRANDGSLTSYDTTFPRTERWVGICYELEYMNVNSNEPYSCIYEIKTNQFYIKNNNTWTVSNDVLDYLKYTSLCRAVGNIMYPVGSVYMSFDNTSPELLFGGTWSLIVGRFLFGTESAVVGLSGDTGGSANAVVVEHSHTAGKYDGYSISNVGVATGNRNVIYPDTSSTSASTRIQTNSTGESGLGKNMPPYITVYMWRRTG